MRPAQVGQLLDGRGAERVGGGEEDLRAAGLEALRELGDRRRLARAVDADDEDDGRHRGPGLRGHGHRGSRVAKSAEELVLERDFGRQVAARARPVDHLDREVGAQVGAR